MARRVRLADAAIGVPRPADMPALHAADRIGPVLAQKDGKAFVAQAAARGERVGQMILPVIGRLLAQGHGDRHLRHHRGAAAADEAAIDEQDIGARLIGRDRRRHAGGARADHQHVRRESRRVALRRDCLHSEPVYTQRTNETQNRAMIPFEFDAAAMETARWRK